MGLEDRLREAARAVEALWADSPATQDRLARLRQRLASDVPAGASSPGPAPADTFTATIPVLIRQCRRELARASAKDEVRSAVSMALSLGLVVGANLAVRGPVRLRGEALRLSEFCGRGREVFTNGFHFSVPDFHSVGLTDGDDLPKILRDTAGLLGEAGIAVIGLACTADEEAMYWSLMETIDALDQARDRTVEMLRRLSEHDPAKSNHWAG
jgi:hypothetical protein